ncbi:PAP/fibrillin family protein [Capilliphycus salinus ALCB114379]|uniref:PAP/fibrillin family protein n=1 Tax=Capilliphycus salinus TaxID=2768948 RepID=UPI0039A5ECB4
MDTKALDRNTAKNNLRDALNQQGGNPKAEAVVAAISQLTALNPTPQPAQNRSLLEGNWLLINAPDFPGGKRTEDGKYIYSLGRLAFNLFQPADLQVLINRVIQPIFPMNEGEKLSYNIEIEFTILDENYPKLQGIVRNQGVCSPQNEQSLQVQFLGGELAPLDPDNSETLKEWLSVFGNQNRKKSVNIPQKIQSFIAQLLFGLEPPQGINNQTGKVSFTMKKSPKGSLEVLYLDEELRITRGNRGTVTVCERI